MADMHRGAFGPVALASQRGPHLKAQHIARNCSSRPVNAPTLGCM